MRTGYLTCDERIWSSQNRNVPDVIRIRKMLQGCFAYRADNPSYQIQLFFVQGTSEAELNKVFLSGMCNLF